jgi:hypothetical protein
LLYVLIALVTLFALYHAEENFRGKRAWNRYEKAAKARGANFDFAACIPPPVPDDQNAANNPIVAMWFPKAQPTDPDWPPLLSKAEQRIASRKNSPDRRTTERFMDLVALKEALASEQAGATNPEPRVGNRGRNRGRDVAEQERTPEERAAAAPAVLEALKVYQPALDELRATSKRPYVRYPIVYKLDDPFSILLPHLAKLKSITLELKVQASAELAAGRADDAFADVMFMIWIADSVKGEPFIIDQLVRIACLQITMQPIWEGLAAHKWSDAQLEKLQDRLLQFDFVSDLPGPVASERAASVGLIQRLGRDSRSRPGITDLFDTGNVPSATRKTANLLSSFVPRGWFYFEALNYCQWMDEQMQNGIDLQKKTINPQQIEANNARMEQALGSSAGVHTVFQHLFFARLLLPALEKMSRRFALGQVAADEAALACALERYRLANGKLPENLDALAPKYIARLPHDVLTGVPLKFERVSDAEFVLSSVGWPIPENSGKGFVSNEGGRPQNRPGDWVWHSAAP